jgi:hypothetical protein
MVLAIQCDDGHVRAARRGDGYRFDRLVQDLKDALGPSSGLTCDDVEVGYLKNIMKEYDGKGDQGWRPYFHGDASRGYTRNLVDEGNGKSNLVRSSRPGRSHGQEELTAAVACPRLEPWEG